MPYEQRELTEPAIGFSIDKRVVSIPTPIMMFEINTTSNYRIEINFAIKEYLYKRLDSLTYTLQAIDNKTLASGSLPLMNGEIQNKGKLRHNSLTDSIYVAVSNGKAKTTYFDSIVFYSGVKEYIVTLPRILLQKHKQDLKGDFVIYATDINNKTKQITLKNIFLEYYEPRIITFWTRYHDPHTSARNGQ